MSTTPSGAEWATRRRVLDAAARPVAFPLGGIGTGNVSLGARGELRDWELANRPDKGAALPYSSFAIRTQTGDDAPFTRVLEAMPRPPFDDDQGHAISGFGLPRLRDTRFHGEYPVAGVEFVDERLPVSVFLTAYTPFIPLDVAGSGIPVAVLSYSVRNAASVPVDVAIAGTLTNPVGHVGRDMLHFPVFEGTPSNEERRGDGLTGIRFGSDLPGAHPLAGSAALATTDDGDVTLTHQWVTSAWQDGIQRFWDDFRADGRLEPETRFTLDDEVHDWIPRSRTGSLAISRTLAPGEEHDFEFLLAWHFPNRPRAWQGNIRLDDTHADQTVRNDYASRYEDAWAVAADVAARRPELEAATFAFHDALHGSSLPDEVVDAASATLVALRSTTCMVLEGGVFAAWEGSFDHSGSCEGTCTHVWNYAQAAAWLFPTLERSARRTEFLHETRDDGRMNFRANSVFGNEPWDFHPAVDGQLGTIVRLHREWQLGAGDEFLRELWPHAARALEFALREWDHDGDLVLEQVQHNTYDIEFHGANPLSGSMLYAALRAAAALSGHLGDEASARRYADAATDGAARMDELLFNGEYYVQQLPPGDEHRYQFGDGCLADQLFGQTLAHLTGLGHLFPPEHVRSAVAAVHRHNLLDRVADHDNVQRSYALADDGGLVLCSWPRGGRPALPFVYSDEVWTGIEYQVATHLVYEGLVDEALEIVRTVRARHDGERRNPWNEAECGNHYARSLAAWGLVVALSGAQANNARGELGFAPAVAGDFASVFSSGTAWGTVRIAGGSVELTVLGGRLDASTVSVRPFGASVTTAFLTSGPTPTGGVIRFRTENE